MGLYSKMLAIMEDSEALSKDMQVGGGSFGYKAVSEATVLNLIKPLLKKHKVVIFPTSVQSEERHDTHMTKKGETTRLMTCINVQWKIVDTESGESDTLASIGNGADTQDKGSGKAFTYAYKAMLQKTFCLFSGEDTDNTHSKDMDDKNTFVSIDCNDIITTAHKKGFSAASVEKKLFEEYRHGMQYITKKEHDEFLNKLNLLPDK